MKHTEYLPGKCQFCKNDICLNCCFDGICENCQKARQPLIAEITRLKADLAKWEANYERWKGEGAFG